MNLATLKSRTRPLEVECEGETLKLEYAPGRFTGELVDKVVSAADDVAKARLIANACAAVIDSWDLTDGKKAVAATEDTLLQLPMVLLVEIFKAINEDNDPNRKTSAA